MPSELHRPATPAAPPRTDERPEELARRYREVRGLTEKLCAPLEVEDYVVQSMPDASPARWHLAHTTWFFETFLLANADPTYRPFHAEYSFLFNSYYNSVGDRWERAARGVDGRSFPWGEGFDTRLANTREGGRSGTTAVGAYPDGASPDGVYDMAGNVWEWTSSLDRPYPYDREDGREAAGPGRRIMRGGCYANPHGYARCACRFRLAPGTHNEFTGFRLALSLAEGGAQ